MPDREGSAGRPTRRPSPATPRRSGTSTFYWNSLRLKGDANAAEVRGRRYLAFVPGAGTASTQESTGRAGAVRKRLGLARFRRRKLKLVKTRTRAAADDVRDAAPHARRLEHAYDLDDENKRKDYAVAVIEYLLNWDFALKELPLAKA